MLRRVVLLFPLLLALAGCSGTIEPPNTVHGQTGNVSPDKGAHTPQPGAIVPHPTGPLAPAAYQHKHAQG